MCVCERFIYSHERSTYFPAAEKADRSLEIYIYLSQIDECRRNCLFQVVSEEVAEEKDEAMAERELAEDAEWKLIQQNTFTRYGSFKGTVLRDRYQKLTKKDRSWP
jgi:hypothetical protein